MKGAREAARYLVDCSRRASEMAVPVCHLYGGSVGQKKTTVTQSPHQYLLKIANIKFLKQSISQFGITVMVLVGAGHDDGDGGSSSSRGRNRFNRCRGCLPVDSCQLYQAAVVVSSAADLRELYNTYCKLAFHCVLT